MNDNIQSFLESFSTLTKKPQSYLSSQPDLIERIKLLIKDLYDFTKSRENADIKGNALPELIIEEFDDEQIWQQLELQNDSFKKYLLENVSQLVDDKSRLTFPLKLIERNGVKVFQTNSDAESDKEHSPNQQEGENYLDDEDMFGSEAGSGDNMALDSQLKDKSDKTKKDERKSSIVDDKFFKLADMEEFLEAEEKNDGKSDKINNLTNFFEDPPGDDGSDAENLFYNDFFGPPENENLNETKSKNISGQQNELEEDFGCIEFAEDDLDEEEDDIGSIEFGEDNLDKEEFDVDNKRNKNVRFNLNYEDDKDKMEIDKENSKIKSESDDKSIKSTLELRQERLKKMINKLEEEAISEKPWQLKGEVTGGIRPQNSLLEELVDFDISARPAPVITEETTLRLEDIILRRIKDKSWDDVERKFKPVESPAEFKKKLVLDQEKSKFSLAEIYEQEFIKQRDATKQVNGDTEVQEVEPPLHNEVRAMMTSLFNKLDALSNYHYTPRPAVPELKIISNERAITMEEVAPIITNEASLLAPEEIQGKKKGGLIGKDERTKTDKKRARRLKKKHQRLKQNFQLKKIANKFNIKNGKNDKAAIKNRFKIVLNESNVSEMEHKTHKSIRSSTAFFQNLQNEITSSIKKKTQPVKKKNNSLQMSAKKLKL
uniref:U3 small nucleolar ribonucleoprotein protein MPP10 n=2 Tax=Clastoptera arizonana TaxID=38151 RepID=A0A1B6E782_9HEMI